MDTRIEEVRGRDVRHWTTRGHNEGRHPKTTTYAFQLFVDGVDSGALTVGLNASPCLGRGICGGKYSDRVYVLSRLVVQDGLPARVKEDFTLSCLALLEKKGDFVLVAYDDGDWGTTYPVYEALGFLYTGATSERTDIDPGPGKHSRHYEKTSAVDAPRKFRSAKHRYVLFLGPEADEMRTALKYPVLREPKVKVGVK